MDEPTGLQRMDALINRLIESDQTGDAIDPFDVARELGEIRALLMAAPSVHRSASDQRHYRCQACGTITHGTQTPARCARCRGSDLVGADIEGSPAAG